MTKIQFTNLKALEKYVQDQIHNSLNSNDKPLENVAKQAMSYAVDEIVYKAYTPEKYERRKEKGGLADENTMIFTYHGKTPNGIVSYFENTAFGNDTLEDTFMADTIENGLGRNWMKEGEWSEPRPFVKATEYLLTNPTAYPAVLEAFRKTLKQSGMNIK